MGIYCLEKQELSLDGIAEKIEKVTKEQSVDVDKLVA
jgi:hypothetical protein